MSEPVQPIDSDDLIVWPDGTQCFRSELSQFSHMSDDYEVIPFQSEQWMSITYRLSAWPP